MLKNKQITFYVKRFAMSNVYLSIQEAQDIHLTLSTQEYMLYTTVKGMVLENPIAEELLNPNLAKRLGISVKTVANVKSSLKKKGYLIINHYRDMDNDLRADVWVGKDQVHLYNLGLKVEITDAKFYNQILKKYNLLDPSLTKDERQELVSKINEEYKESK